MGDDEALQPVAPQILNETILRMVMVHQAGLRQIEFPGEPPELDPAQRIFWRGLRSRYAQADLAWVNSLAWRAMALGELVGSGALGEWVIDEGAGAAILPDEVIEVAAALPLRMGCPFNQNEFLAELSRYPLR